MALVHRLTNQLHPLPPDPTNLEPTDTDVIRLSVDWHAVVLRDGMAVIGMRPDQGTHDPYFGYAEVYLRSTYLDAILLGLLQNHRLTHLEVIATLDSAKTTAMADLEQQISTFRHQIWAQHLTPHGTPNKLLTVYQSQHTLRERFEQLLTEISDFNRLTRDDESHHANSAIVVLTLLTVPADISLAILEVLQTSSPSWPPPVSFLRPSFSAHAPRVSPYAHYAAA
ncbi:hypothetical protein HNP84_001121 [Thermocatellispora tengchongensis]|uniref:Uncharacterized protein n=1 Tax=Thermocatellispora tengchongensis TaxID=1073253 RepID=A0A840P5X8_9ACTN|nr:hypothetical protein [Thermocatellispora tengchongensis]MBB5131415.1 hypothetical protein [Thermocatellispora tengchongensis]